MRLVLLHTNAQLLTEWVLIGLLLLATLVALLVEPAEALRRRYEERRSASARSARGLDAWAYISRAFRVLHEHPWLALAGLGGVLLALLCARCLPAC